MILLLPIVLISYDVYLLALESLCLKSTRAYLNYRSVNQLSYSHWPLKYFISSASRSLTRVSRICASVSVSVNATTEQREVKMGGEGSDASYISRCVKLFIIPDISDFHGR